MHFRPDRVARHTPDPARRAEPFRLGRLARVLVLAVTVASATAPAQPESDDSDAPLFTFGLIADAQYCDCEAGGSRFYRRSLQKLSEAVDTLNARNVSFTIHLGDFIDRDFESFAPVKAIYDRLDAPAYHVLGNHDFSVEPDHLDEVPELLGMPDRYFSIDRPGWRFIVLDGNDVSLYATRELSPRRATADSLFQELSDAGAANAQTWSGAIGDDQMKWLRRTLADAQNGGRRVALFAHFPAYPWGAHNLWNDRALVSLLEEFDRVAAYLNGHNHSGAYAALNGIHYVTIPGMVETPDTNAFAVVDVYPDRLIINGFGRVPTRTLELDKPVDGEPKTP